MPLYPAHRFLNRDYIMFDCGGVAFTEAGFYLSAVKTQMRGCETEPLPPIFLRLPLRFPVHMIERLPVGASHASCVCS